MNESCKSVGESTSGRGSMRGGHWGCSLYERKSGQPQKQQEPVPPGFVALERTLDFTLSDMGPFGRLLNRHDTT